MKKLAEIRNCILGILTASLILVQTLFAAGLPFPYAGNEGAASAHKTEVKQEITAKTSYVVVDTRITLATFLFFWLVRVFTIDVPFIAYQNCKAFFVNPHVFHVFYTCLRALAP